jgi:hypothetical protein
MNSLKDPGLQFNMYALCMGKTVMSPHLFVPKYICYQIYCFPTEKFLWFPLPKGEKKKVS